MLRYSGTGVVGGGVVGAGVVGTGVVGTGVVGGGVVGAGVVGVGVIVPPLLRTSVRVTHADTCPLLEVARTRKVY